MFSNTWSGSFRSLYLIKELSYYVYLKKGRIGILSAVNLGKETVSN